MNSNIVLETTNLGKKYHLHEKPVYRLLDIISGGLKSYHSDFWALRGINISVERGEVLGILGENGSGKSTLLRLIQGITQATEGRMVVRGKVGSILELGLGFRPEFTGRENIFMNAQILGLSKKEIERKYEEIESFADIGDFIEQPIRTYSSGMMLRLGFSVATSFQPDLLLIDEVISVGDTYFQAKSFNRINEMKKHGTAIVFISHDMLVIQNFCDKAALLKDGKIIKAGAPVAVVWEYIKDLVQGSREVTGLPSERIAEKVEGKEMLGEVVEKEGEKKAKIVSVRSENTDGDEIQAVRAGEEFRVRITYECYDLQEEYSVGFIIRNELGNIIYVKTTHYEQINLNNLVQWGAENEIVFSMKALLKDGVYHIQGGVTNLRESIFHLKAMDYPIRVINPNRVSGIIDLNAKISIIHT